MQIQDDRTFQAALKALDGRSQRVAAATFAEHVLPLCEDRKLAEVVEIARNRNASRLALSEALKIAKSSAIHSRTRYGAEGDWHKQTEYFIAKAAIAALSPRCQMPEGIAWHAALSSRLARASAAIEYDNDADMQERTDQYSILINLLDLEHGVST